MGWYREVDDGSSIAAAPAGGREGMGATGGGAKNGSQRDNHGFTKTLSLVELLPSASRSRMTPMPDLAGACEEKVWLWWIWWWNEAAAVVAQEGKGWAGGPSHSQVFLVNYYVSWHKKA